MTNSWRHTKCLTVTPHPHVHQWSKIYTWRLPLRIIYRTQRIFQPISDSQAVTCVSNSSWHPSKGFKTEPSQHETNRLMLERRHTPVTLLERDLDAQDSLRQWILDSLSILDSSWADDPYSRRSTAGYVFILNNGPISWSSRRQATVSTSTCEAEYFAQTETACEAVWIRGLLGELGILETTLEEGCPKTISPHTTIFADNQGAVKLTENPEYHRKTKHIPIRDHKKRELVAEGVVHFEWIPTWRGGCGRSYQAPRHLQVQGVRWNIGNGLAIAL